MGVLEQIIAEFLFLAFVFGIGCLSGVIPLILSYIRKLVGIRDLTWEEAIAKYWGVDAKKLKEEEQKRKRIRQMREEKEELDASEETSELNGVESSAVMDEEDEEID